MMVTMATGELLLSIGTCCLHAHAVKSDTAEPVSCPVRLQARLKDPIKIPQKKREADNKNKIPR
jgi:hypothetical protein